MTVADGRTARVRVDYSQYQVAAGAEMTVGDDSVPGLLRDMGRQAVAVLTGLQSGVITVTAHAVATAPAQVDPGWDVVAETDLDCPEGITGRTTRLTSCSCYSTHQDWEYGATRSSTSRQRGSHSYGHGQPAAGPRSSGRRQPAV
jgi:hypothetical protein